MKKFIAILFLVLFACPSRGQSGLGVNTYMGDFIRTNARPFMAMA